MVSQMSEERTAFEAWAKERNNGKDILKCHDGTYANHECEWAAWRAGIEFLRQKVAPVAWRFMIEGTWFTGSTKEGCEKALEKASLSYEVPILPLYAAPQPLQSEGK